MSVECPYCGQENELEYSDGEGTCQMTTHQFQCSQCEKRFVFTSEISFDHFAEKAECLNGGEHYFARTHTSPWQCTSMRCNTCNEERQPTNSEWCAIYDEVNNATYSRIKPEHHNPEVQAALNKHLNLQES